MLGAPNDNPTIERHCTTIRTAQQDLPSGPIGQGSHEDADSDGLHEVKSAGVDQRGFQHPDNADSVADTGKYDEDKPPELYRGQSECRRRAYDVC